MRVSQTGGRAGDSFTSPRTQRERIESECEREGFELIEVFEELDVSGGRALDTRPGLSAAVRMIEAGEAEVIVAAYFDRLLRSLSTQAELLARVEAAGGKVRAVDAGDIGAGTPGEWLDSTMRGMFAEYQRRQGAERTRDAQADAIARGVAPWPRVTPGYRRGADGRFEVDEELAPAIRRAFEMRADGASISTVRALLTEHGLRCSFRSVQTLLSSRVLLGELHFGERLVDGKRIVGKYEPNLSAWPAIVERELWNRCQAVVAPRGPQGKSERLLARLGVVRCAGCEGRMCVSRSRAGSWSYRCPTPDCEARASIKAEVIEEHVVEAVRDARSNVRGSASIDAAVRGAEVEVEVAQATLDGAINALAVVAAEPAAIERLAALSADRDAARDRLEQLGGVRGATLMLDADWEWELLTIDEQRAVIAATVERVTVAKGRGLDRVRVVLIADQAEVERILSGAARRVQASA